MVCKMLQHYTPYNWPVFGIALGTMWCVCVMWYYLKLSSYQGSICDVKDLLIRMMFASSFIHYFPLFCFPFFSLLNSLKAHLSTPFYGFYFLFWTISPSKQSNKLPKLKVYCIDLMYNISIIMSVNSIFADNFWDMKHYRAHHSFWQRPK